eukprot:c19276_g1_i1 orf=158-1378(+)
MGCLLSLARNDGDASSHNQAEMIPMAVFAPGMRVPCQPLDFSSKLHGLFPAQILDQLSSSQARVVALARAAEEEAASLLSKLKSRRNCATQHGGKAVADLQQALEDYLILLLGLTKEGNESTRAVPFAWKNQEDTQLETSISDCHYEVLSVLHVMAVLGLMQANLLLSPKASSDYQTRTTEERRKEAIDVFLKVSGLLECAMKFVMPKLSQELKAKLPTDLKDDVLQALSMQALGQSVEIQLGLAVDNLKATLAVKRRLACEQVKYWQKAHENLQNVDVGGCWGGKHHLFVSWKLAAAKAAAFYFHGLILDEGSEAGTHAKAIVCLQTADGHLKESQKLCVNFCLANPTTRSIPIWGAMKYLTERIPREYSSKARMNRGEKVPNQVPELPDFPLSLHPEEFKLPGI